MNALNFRSSQVYLDSDGVVHVENKTIGEMIASVDKQNGEKLTNSACGNADCSGTSNIGSCSNSSSCSNTNTSVCRNYDLCSATDNTYGCENNGTCKKQEQ